METGAVAKRTGRRRRSTNARRLGKTDWLEAGLAMLGERGQGGVRLDTLCARLGVTKGSFYWHFSDRADLLAGLLTFWEQRETLAIIDEIEAAGGDPEERIWRLLRRVASKDYDFSAELAIRHWARSDGAAASVVKGVDAKRVGYFRSLLVELGFAEADALDRAVFLYSVNLGQGSIVRREARAHRTARLRAAMQLIVAPPGG